MAFQKISVGSTFPETPSFTAAADMPIRIVYGDRKRGTVYWVTTVDDTKPNLLIEDFSPIQSGAYADVTLAADERLWLAGHEVEDDAYIVLMS